jgi:hypothetical protein
LSALNGAGYDVAPGNATKDYEMTRCHLLFAFTYLLACGSPHGGGGHDGGRDGQMIDSAPTTNPPILYLNPNAADTEVFLSGTPPNHEY